MPVRCYGYNIIEGYKFMCKRERNINEIVERDIMGIIHDHGDLMRAGTPRCPKLPTRYDILVVIFFSP
jgi:hypothetical protein